MRRNRQRQLLFPAAAALVLAGACRQSAQPPNGFEGAVPARAPDPDLFMSPIGSGDEPLVVEVVDFAVLPDAGGHAPSAKRLVEAPGANRFFIASADTMVYSVAHDGGRASPYLGLRSYWPTSQLPRPVPVATSGPQRPRPVPATTAGPGDHGRSNAEAGWMRLRGIACHPQFADEGAPGFGKFYTLIDDWDTEPPADFDPGFGSPDTLDTVLLEWTAADPMATTYDGGPPRELMRIEMPYAHHTGGQIAFDPQAGPDDPGFGLLYIGLGDGGRNGDPLGLAQDLSKVHGKLLRINPLGSNSANGRYGVPADNPFAIDGRDDTLGETYAFGLRNPASFGWDALNGTLFVADIGDNAVDEVSIVRPGANLGWDLWEGTFRVVHRQPLARRVRQLLAWSRHLATGDGFLYTDYHDVSPADGRGDPEISYPVVEYDHVDPLLNPARAAVTGVVVCRRCSIPQLEGKAVFGDLVVGEIFYFSADRLPRGGQAGIRRILLDHDGAQTTLLQIVRETMTAQDRARSHRVDLHFGTSAAGDVFLLNHYDGVIRRLNGDPPSTASLLSSPGN